MKKVTFLIFTFYCFTAYSACENQLHGIRGPADKPKISIQSNSRLGSNFSYFRNYSLNNCDEEELGNIVVSGVSPGPGWFPFFNPVGSWIYLGGRDGAGGGSSMSPEKEAYCELKDQATALISALPVTGTAANGYSIGQATSTWARAVINAGLRDIQI